MRLALSMSEINENVLNIEIIRYLRKSYPAIKLFFIVSNHFFLHTHTCDELQRGIREVFLSFPGGFRKLYRIYKNILHSFPGDFKILVKSDIF